MGSARSENKVGWACRTVLVLLGSALGQTGNPSSITQRRIHKNTRSRPGVTSHSGGLAFHAIALDSRCQGKRRAHPEEDQGVSSIKPDYSGRQMDGTEEVARGLVVTGGGGPVPLEPGKKILDQVSRLVEVAVIGE